MPVYIILAFKAMRFRALGHGDWVRSENDMKCPSANELKSSNLIGYKQFIFKYTKRYGPSPWKSYISTMDKHYLLDAAIFPMHPSSLLPRVRTFFYYVLMRSTQKVAGKKAQLTSWVSSARDEGLVDHYGIIIVSSGMCAVAELAMSFLSSW